MSISSGSAMAEFLMPVPLNVQRGFQTAAQDGSFDIKRTWPLGTGSEHSLAQLAISRELRTLDPPIVSWKS